MLTDRPTNRAALLLVVAALAFLQFGLEPVFESWYAKPNLLVCGLLIFARQVRPAAAATMGFLLGVLQDSIAVSHFGLGAFLLVALGYLGSQTRDLFLGEERLFIGTYLFAGTLIYEIAGHMLIGGGGSLLGFAFLRAPLDGIATGVVGYLVLPVVRSS